MCQIEFDPGFIFVFKVALCSDTTNVTEVSCLCDKGKAFQKFVAREADAGTV